MPVRPARTVSHTHVPLYRVERQGWTQLLDPSFSQRQTDNRWNTAAFPALYCCCSLPVARAVCRDKLLRAGVMSVHQLAREYRPRLVDLQWQGTVVDVASPEGITTAGFPLTYPGGVTIARTQVAATAWHGEGREGVVCRSHALHLSGETAWTGSHEPWGEVAIFMQNAGVAPTPLLPPHDDLAWLGE